MDRAQEAGGIDEVTVVQVESLNLHQDVYPDSLRTAHRHVLDNWSNVQRNLVSHQHRLEEAFDNDMINHVAENTYVNGIRLENAYPDLREYMHNHYSPSEHDLVSMFGLDQLNLSEHAIRDVNYNIQLNEHFMEERTRVYVSNVNRYLEQAERNVWQARTELNELTNELEALEFERQEAEDFADFIENPNEFLQLSAAEYVVKSEQASAKTYYYGTIAGLAIASGLITSLAFARKKVVGKKSEEDFEALL